MPLGRRGFTTLDTLIAGGLVAASLASIAALLIYAENIKRNSAVAVVQAAAAANKARMDAGKRAVTGKLDAKSLLVTDGDMENRDWEFHPYSFYGAETAVAPCILASAQRKTAGKRGTDQKPYSTWGVCVSAKGAVQRFSSSCTLSCVEEAAPVVVEQPRRVAEPVRRPRKIVIDVPDLGADPDPKPVVKHGCSVKGCLGASCCDRETDKCVSCPGGSCCETDIGCSGTCYNDDDCLQGCRCVKIPGSPSGSCRGG